MQISYICMHVCTYIYMRMPAWIHAFEHCFISLSVAALANSSGQALFCWHQLIRKWVQTHSLDSIYGTYVYINYMVCIFGSLYKVLPALSRLRTVVERFVKLSGWLLPSKRRTLLEKSFCVSQILGVSLICRYAF